MRRHFFLLCALLMGCSSSSPGTPDTTDGGPDGASTDIDAAGNEDAAAFTADYFIGADITWVQRDEANGATYTDGTQREILQLLKDHGFNYIRLRTFVDPKAYDGYDKVNGYADLAHTITFGKRIKDAGMGFLLDFHYSDNWADPGKQCVPAAWQNATTIEQLATYVHDYTADAITQLIAGGARPDMVQIGNEITPGMLIHRCNSNGSPGSPPSYNRVTGSISNWSNLGTLLKAGSQAVRDIDPAILLMLHIDRGKDFVTSRDFINNALAQGVSFDVFGESTYTAWQGLPSDWQSTFTQLADAFPTLKFVSAEYGPEQRSINDTLFGLPNRQGIGTFNWEPTTLGQWNTTPPTSTTPAVGHSLFTAGAGSVYTATADLALYDLMKTDYAERL